MEFLDTSLVNNGTNPLLCDNRALGYYSSLVEFRDRCNLPRFTLSRQPIQPLATVAVSVVILRDPSSEPSACAGGVASLPVSIGATCHPSLASNWPNGNAIQSNKSVLRRRKLTHRGGIGGGNSRGTAATSILASRCRFHFAISLLYDGGEPPNTNYSCSVSVASGLGVSFNKALSRN